MANKTAEYPKQIFLHRQEGDICIEEAMWCGERLDLKDVEYVKKSDRIQWAIEKHKQWVIEYNTHLTELQFPDWLKTHSEDL